MRQIETEGREGSLGNKCCRVRSKRRNDTGTVNHSGGSVDIKRKIVKTLHLKQFYKQSNLRIDQ